MLDERSRYLRRGPVGVVAGTLGVDDEEMSASPFFRVLYDDQERQIGSPVCPTSIFLVSWRLRWVLQIRVVGGITRDGN